MIKETISKIVRATYLIPFFGTVIRGYVQKIRSKRDHYQDQAYWNESLNGWASTYLGGTFWNDLRNSVTVELAKHVAPSATSILDIGCAGATLALALDSKYSVYYGVDISDIAISKAQETLTASSMSQEIDFSFQLSVSTVQDYKPNRKFDVIVFNEVLYYLTLNEVANCMRRYSTFLSDNGVILISLKDHEMCRPVQTVISKEIVFLHAVLFQNKSLPSWKIIKNAENPGCLIQAFRAKGSNQVP